MKIGKLKVKFVMSTGNVVVVKCKKINMTKLSGSKGSRECEITAADRLWSIDLDHVVAVTAKWCLF